MCSGLPEQELAAALETSGDKAAAAAAALTLPWSLWGSGVLPGWKLLRRNMGGIGKGMWREAMEKK